MKKIYIYLVSMLVCASAFSQNKTQDRSMVVEESYVADFSMGSKIMPYAPAHTTSKNKRVGSYLTGSRELDGYYRQDMPVADVSAEVESETPVLLRFGYGLRNTMDALLYAGINCGNKSRIELSSKADGENSSVSDNWTKRLYNWDSDLNFTHSGDKCLLSAGVFFDNVFFNFRPGEDSASNRQSVKNIGAHLSFKSTLQSKYPYHVELSYNNLSHDRGYNNVALNSGILFGAGQGGTFGLDFNVASQFGDYANMTLAPFYRLTKGKMMLTSGINLDFLSESGSRFNVSPNVDFNMRFTPCFAMFVGVNGGFAQYSATELYKESPYIIADSLKIEQGYDLVDAKLGLSIDKSDLLSVSLSAGYRNSKNSLFQTESKDKYVTTLLKQHDLSCFDVEMFANINSLPGIGLNLFAAYYSYINIDKAYLLLKPVARVDADLRVHLFRHFYSTLSYQWAYYNDLPSKQNLALRVDGEFSPNMGLYVSLENILNKDYYDYAGYMHHKFSAMAGVLFRF